MTIEKWTDKGKGRYQTTARVPKKRGIYVLRARHERGMWYPDVTFALGPTLGPGYCPPGFPDRRQAQERAEKAARHHAATGQWHSGEK